MNLLQRGLLAYDRSPPLLTLAGGYTFRAASYVVVPLGVALTYALVAARKPALLVALLLLGSCGPYIPPQPGSPCGWDGDCPGFDCDCGPGLETGARLCLPTNRCADEAEACDEACFQDFGIKP